MAPAARLGILFFSDNSAIEGGPSEQQQADVSSKLCVCEPVKSDKSDPPLVGLQSPL